MSPETRDFLDQVRDAEDPSPETEERVLSALSAAIVTGGLGAGAYGWAKLLEPLTSWGISGLKLGTVALCVVAIGKAADSPRTEVPSTHAVAVAPSRAHETIPAPPPPQPPPAAATSAKPEPAARASARTARPAPSLRDELSLLAEVRSALQRGDGATALRLLDRHDTSDRQLLAERAAARVLALCAAGKTDEARQAAAEFARRHPSSLQLSAVARSCAGER